mmetsp:Transcript_37613/g.60931  ORF Transcript_37613/g.60931 Transcript_37613/m.60931 type:complete len:235 (+) Transcript_37613:193-897(+)
MREFKERSDHLRIELERWTRRYRQLDPSGADIDAPLAYISKRHQPQPQKVEDDADPESGSTTVTDGGGGGVVFTPSVTTFDVEYHSLAASNQSISRSDTTTTTTTTDTLPQPKSKKPRTRDVAYGSSETGSGSTTHPLYGVGMSSNHDPSAPENQPLEFKPVKIGVLGLAPGSLFTASSATSSLHHVSHSLKRPPPPPPPNIIGPSQGDPSPTKVVNPLKLLSSYGSDEDENND